MEFATARGVYVRLSHSGAEAGVALSSDGWNSRCRQPEGYINAGEERARIWSCPRYLRESGIVHQQLVNWRRPWSLNRSLPVVCWTFISYSCVWN